MLDRGVVQSNVIGFQPVSRPVEKTFLSFKTEGERLQKVCKNGYM